MAFQDNSGDIILDVVLTDEGRRRLARGDSSFSVVKFALGDDEINYSLFDTGSTTALQDLSILQTPILEAFTNNTSLMKSKLISLTNSNLLYLPVLRLNDVVPGGQTVSGDGNYVVCVDKRTFDDRSTSGDKAIGYDSATGRRDGFLYGLDSGDNKGGLIRVDAGIDSDDVTEIDESLIETSFIVEMDSRLGQIMSADGTSMPGFTVDDDFVATYSFTRTANDSFIYRPSQDELKDSDTPIDGPVASYFQFKIRSSQDLRTSNFLFNRIGSTTSTYLNRAGVAVTGVKFIDSIIRVTGRTTGYAIDIPVRFAKV
jgi:hypothetical protein